MLQLSRGQKQKLAAITPNVQIEAELGAQGANLNFDFSCFGVDDNDQLSDDRYFVFYNQNASPQNEITLSGAGVFYVDLARLPATIGKLVFVITIDGNGTLSQLSSGYFALKAGGNSVARFDFAGADFSSERAIIAAEIYRKDEWRVAAVGQGFAGGLSALLKHFGGEEVPPDLSTEQNRMGMPFVPPVEEPVPVEGRVCVRCGKKVGMWQQMRGFNAATRRCADCERAVASALEQLRRDFLEASASGILQDASWQAMWTRFDPARQKVSHQAALEFIRPEALRFVERLTAMAAADGTITPAAEKYIEQMLQSLAIPAAEQRPIHERLVHLKTIARIREGHLPRVATRHHLEAGEVCHMETTATFRKVNARSTTNISGNLVATSKKLLFLSPSGGKTIQYKNIMRVEETSGAIYLELSTGSGNGKYLVADALWTEAVLTTLTRMAKRQLLEPSAGTMSRHIPQDVKSVVWQRDGGQCVQCRAMTYLEFDHIIPFSRGGANTVGNIQLLFRNCNNAKGDRI